MFVFFLARRYGKRFVLHFTDKEDIQRFDKFFAKNGRSSILLMRMIPVIPNDVISLGAGLTSIKARTYFLLSFSTYFPALLFFNIFGSQLSAFRFNKVIAFFLLVLVIIFLIYLFRAQLTDVLMKKTGRKHGKVLPKGL